MSNIKDLFGKSKSNKIVSNSSLNEIGDPIESANYVKSKVKDIERFVPGVDFSTASNFAFYGLAENYYNDTINYIINEYPYDGSRQERLQWELNGTYLDRYFLENLYPRTNGFVNIGDSYGTVSAPTAGNFSGSSKTEYIKFYSGPNQADDYDGSQKISGYFDDANVFATGSRQEGNIDINGSKGFSVEFWLKKDGWSVSDESTAQVVLDVWNNSTDVSTRGQFTVYIDRTSPNQISYAITSGSVSDTATLGSALPITGGDWNHYALTFENSGDKVNSKLYLNGELNAQTSSIDSIGPITGAVFGHLGSLTRALFAGGAGYGDTGYGKLSGSLDDFRLWKTARNEKEIQQNWFTNIYGGTNSDYQLSFSSSYKYDLSNNVDLGVYFKFNEGIISTSSTNSQDAVVLDYAGRSSNGAWTGYAVGARQTGSAMVLSNAALSEFKDPIIYAANPLVSSVKQEYLSKGIMHDRQNNSALYWSLPSWITSEDLNKSNSALKELTQIMSSYFDTLQMQIQSVPQLQENSYLSGNVKPLAFAGRLLDGKGLVSDEILSNATDLEYFASRNDKQNYEKKLEETKNLIYLNIYNNLTYIFKSKGTEKSFRNLIRCFGVDESIVNINLYGNNSDYELLDNTKNSIVRKRYVDFFEPSRFNATVYQSASSNTNTRSYISSSTEVGFHANTYECEAYFPNNKPASIIDSYSSNFLTSSVFGCHTSGSSEAWGSPDEGNFQVYSIRKALNRNEAFFKLTGTAGGFMPELTSSAYMDVYDDSKWNFSVRVYPSASFGNSVSEAPTSDYIVNFSGYEYVVDNLVNSFEVTGVISNANAKSFLRANKRFFVGAHRTNFTGSILEKSNAQVSSLRVWIDKLSEETLKTHAQKALNYGAENPYENITLSQNGVTLGEDTPYIPQEKTLALNWDFDTVTGSDASGQFLVPDYSSGSLSQTGSWGWMGDITEFQHTGYGFGFPANSTAVIDRKYVNTLIQKRPEVIDSQNMISLIDDSENQIFTQNTRPVDYFFAFEKSMYNVISQEILKVFATIKDFNNLIGAPVNRYRQDYKQLEKMRQLYFERVENVPDFDKFVEYYKWIDGSIASMLQQLAPASANFYDGLNNLVESHVLERNKYWTKFPTLDAQQPDPAAGAAGASERNYPAAGLAVNISSPPNVNQSNVWYEKRLERTDPLITSGNPQVDQNREKIRKVVNQFVSSSGDALAESHAAGGTITQYRGNVYARRNFTKTVEFDSDQAVVLNGGTEFASSKRVDYTNDTIKFDSSNTLQVSAVSFVNRKPRVVLETTKTKVSAKVQNSEDVLGYPTAKTNIAAPFALFSSSVESGYVASFPSPFKKKGIENYHIDAYGPDSSTPVQGPFTDTHVGGRQYRHINVNTASTDNSSNRAEGWNLNLAGTNLTISSRTANQPRATMLRNETAKRPLNIANIKWGTSSANAGNYRFGYEILQTSNRTLNDRYFVKTEGQVPANASSSYVKNLFDYELPRYDLTGTNKNIFVERFNAPGGPETTAGGLNVFGAEYSVYNTINYRNLAVRKSLNEWSQEHSGKFGIKSGSAISADGYNTLASYHKVNRNPAFTSLTQIDRDYYVLEFVNSGSSPGDFGDSGVYLEMFVQPEDDCCDPTEVNIWFNNVTTGLPGTAPTNVVNPVQFDYACAGCTFTNVRDDMYTALEGGMISGAIGFDFHSYQTGSYNGNPSIFFYSNCLIGLKSARVQSGSADTRPTISTITSSCEKEDFDNFFVHHNIPRSDCQYSWIDASVIQDCGQCCFTNYANSEFYIPVGSTGSELAPQLVFTSQSYWGSFNDPVPCGDFTSGRVWGGDSNTIAPASATASFLQFVPVDFVGMNYNIKEVITSSTNQLGYPLSANLVSGTQCSLKQPSYLNTDFVSFLADGYSPHNYTAQTFNSLMLHRNGPYQYPIWKQIRTGEHPVARYHKKRNILSISELPKVINLPNGNGEGRAVEYRNTRADSFKNFYEPPVEFKYKPLVTVANTLGATLNHSYGNNLGLFSQRGFGSQSVGTWLGIGDTKKNVQVYDKLKQIQNAIDVLNYNEVVYPRSSNTGFAKIRRRLNYAEAATRQSFDYKGTWGNYGGVVYNTGSNGIDRNPTERRTFWRDYYKNRNRRQVNWVRYDDLDSYPYIVSSLPNSQEHNDGFGTSLYGLGNSPMVFGNKSIVLASTRIGPPIVYEFSVTGNLKQTSYSTFYSTASGEAQLFLDLGELNSPNYATIGSYYGSVINSDNIGTNTQTPAHLSTQYPTASSYYYHFEVQKDNIHELSGATFSVLNPGILRWRTAEFAGKNPWFDSYEDYSEDIARHAKNYTILPEFKISDHISYYIKNGGFKATNNQFLKLDGANITSSANSPTSNFNEQFFIEYSNSDFKQYFGNFSDDLGKPSSITLKCNAVKKLLPYNGFYPQQRSLQLASLFSQSLGPNISGLSWSAGSAVGTATYSGSLAMQSALQPYYAPGIMFNTIKSGIAVDWAAHIDEPSSFVTQSDKAIAEGYSHQFTSFIGTTSSYRIPFESIMDPLGGNYVPVSSSALNDKLYLLNPSLQGYAAPDAFYTSSIRNPYVNIRDQERRDAQKNNSEYQLYKMASQNFFAEVPNFFLENGQESGKLKSITSDVTDKDVTLESGSVYFMDIVLYKDQDLVMVEDYLNGARDFPIVTGSTSSNHLTASSGAPNEPLFPGDSYRSYNGRFFGPPVKADTTIDKDYKWGIDDNYVSDPGFAPYTPPYFYGKSVATIRYVADGNDETRGGFSFEKMKNNCLRGVGGSSITYHNPDLDAAFNTLGSYQPWRKGELVGIYTPRSIADTDRMSISSSLSIFGIKPIEQLRVDNLGNVEQQVGVYDSNKLVICPKMETPVLNFANQSGQVWGDTAPQGTQSYPLLTGRGMWSGYGAVPTSSSLNFGIERTKLDPSRTNTVDSSQMKSLVDVLFDGQEKTETVGELKGQKIISEAIVAIPFVENSYGNRSKFAYTVSVMKDKNFFGINKTVFRKVKEDYIKNRNNPEKELKPDSQSIQIMVERMSNYVMPPQLDFLNDTTISPFVAYIFEFNAQLDQEDLSDIWQGLMPKIATTAELSGLGTNELDKDGFGLDSFEFTHKTGKDEFYGGKELPCDIRWMVFKVKRRANYEYNKIRPDFNESAITPNNKKIKGGAVLENPYSYNWPYDYFSLVELGQLEAQDNFVLSQGSGSIGTGRLPQFNFLGGGS